MKIAVAQDHGMVAQHFGHCEGFAIFEAENNEVAKSEWFTNPGHKPGFLPDFLDEKGVNVIISGGMGGGAVRLFQQKGIEVVVGASGSSDSVVNHYLQGTLESSGKICEGHGHGHGHGQKHKHKHKHNHKHKHKHKHCL